jgi:hypothetical protein
MTDGLAGVIIIGAGAGVTTVAEGGGAGGAVFTVQAARPSEVATTARTGSRRIRVLRCMNQQVRNFEPRISYRMAHHDSFVKIAA